jgi:formylglycine-generating enzyme required for sulfatase activity
MNRYLYLAFFFIIGSFSTVIGQQLSVKSFRALPNDMDARQNYKTIDQNGELCAIIKVVTSEKGFRFDIGSLGITKTEQQTGEIWLYVPHGARRVSIFHESLGVLRDYQFPEKIDEGVCYELVLVSGKTVTTVVANEIESQWLIITSEPTGADVFINDEQVGVTPYQNELPLGKYSYRIQKALYLNSAGLVELNNAYDKARVEVKLKPNFCSLEVTSEPESGAMIFLNGLETGKTTPCVLDKLPIGEHTVTASLNMYSTEVKKVTLQQGEMKTLSFSLKPTFGTVLVHTSPKSDIYISGVFKGNGEWQGRLSPGVYTFEAQIEGHRTAIVKQAVHIGVPLDLTLQPIPRTGSLKITSVPIDATIKIAGKDYGTTPSTIRNMLIGTYTVELSLPGYATALEKVNITEEAISTVNVILQNGREVTILSTPNGTDLYIDDKLIGLTPYVVSLPFGFHTFRISKDGKKSEKQVNIAQSGGESSFTLSFDIKSFNETVNGVSFDMIPIEGGSFMMGSNDGDRDEQPIHRVTVSDFSIGNTEVTQALWKAVMGNNPSYFKGDNLPVDNVSWSDVQEFIEKLNHLTGKKYRLPTEAEWEYAAGGGSKNRTKWAGTDVESLLGNYAWYNTNSGDKTHDVATKLPNSLGLYDMTGNVWEWCSDRFGDYSINDQMNPTGVTSGSLRAFRGGAWAYGLQNCRVSSRDRNKIKYTRYFVGFRLVLVP